MKKLSTGNKNAGAPTRLRVLLAALLHLAILPYSIYAADVVVYGGTSGGVAAAVAAARQGKSVVLINPAPHVGGTSASGLGFADVWYIKAIGGVSREFFERIGEHYTGERTFQRAFEPQVAENIFLQMLNEAAVVHHSGPENTVISATVKQQRIRSIHLQDGRTIAGQMFIDASYEGDLMAAAGVSWTLGREAMATYREIFAGVRYPTKYRPLDPYMEPGNPASGLIPGVEANDGAAVGSADDRVQTYNYRLCLTQDEKNRVPFTAPEGYRAARYELLARSIESYRQRNGKISFGDIVQLETIPGNKTDVNNSYRTIDGSTDMVGANRGWAVGDAAARKAIALEHERYIRGMLYFLQTSERVPANVREEAERWGYAADEFTDNDHFPWQLYVRESRRMVSDYILTEWNYGPTIERYPFGPATKPIALAGFFLDSHGVRMLPNGVEGLISTYPAEPVKIDYRSIVPRSGEAENLFVTFALSASHVIFACLRMEPTFMMTSHAAGTAAALALDQNVAVQELSYTDLAKTLREEGAILDWGNPRPDVILDTKEISANRVVDGISRSAGWTFRSGKPTAYGRCFYIDQGSKKGTAWFKYEAQLEPKTRYALQIWFVASPGYEKQVPLELTAGPVSEQFFVDQTKLNSWVWVTEFETDHTGKVEAVIRNRGTSRPVVADALGFRRLGPVK